MAQMVDPVWEMVQNAEKRQRFQRRHRHAESARKTSSWQELEKKRVWGPTKTDGLGMVGKYIYIHTNLCFFIGVVLDFFWDLFGLRLNNMKHS